MTPTIRQESPLSPDLTPIFERHHAQMHADTPPGSIHMLPREDLVGPGLHFFVLREGATVLGMAALKNLGQRHGEIKSMHVLAEHRGRGLSRMLLRHLMQTARELGMTRLSLETGAQASFAAARGLYATEGFSDCPPFGSYRADPHSAFMTRTI